MRKITLIMMRMILNKAKNDRFSCDNTIIKQAYDNMIKSYESTIMFLKSQK